MNKKLPLLVSTVALLGGLVFTPALRADDKPAEKPKHQKKVGPRVLKKYDENHNGVLDEDERAAWEADKARRRERQKVKKAPTDKPTSAREDGQGDGAPN